MNIKQATRTLIQHNTWRRGADIDMLDCKVIGEAIDVAIKALKKLDKIEKDQELKDMHYEC